MSDVDISKIKTGDRVLVELVVRDDRRPCNSVNCKSPTGGWCYAIEQGDIVGHTPAPREIKVGDRVTGHFDNEAYDVIGVDGNEVWLKNSNGARFDLAAKRLRHADPAP